MTPLMTPDDALALLKDGNRRFLEDAPLAVHGDRMSRLRMAAAQRPVAAYLSCSDSRVAPELLFGRGLGELFIVRNAGNSLCSTALGSLEFAVTALGVPLIVVMGHENCGAVRAAVSVVKEHYGYSANISKVLQPLYPAIMEVGEDCQHDLVNAAGRHNVHRVVRELQEEASPALRRPQELGTLKIVGAFYEMASGAVQWLDDK
ncbi:MAG: carbonic anhydrase [Sphingomonadales bacterium]|jgi:carbonic anhydrase|nr:carbonic anhydrase [Sphingomonadales bacterium]MBK9004134.1 carbonic anhydrase [Sphingomonadales bacterium]MBK9269310.1 carbonic anhydrase [Sphingomonadales bacterium]MBP6434580.1 carbonic anhydrase [Sphingorhabdus sp.]